MHLGKRRISAKIAILANFTPTMNLTTPALLFPAISLLLLAYTNRFLVLAQLIRQLRSQENLTDVVIRQIANLRSRITMMRRMQALGVTSFILCALSMFLVFIDLLLIAQYVFGISLFLLVLSLLFSLVEILVSTKAIEIELEGIEKSMHRPD
ncbi:MAG: hypothetical protein JWR25_775 [Noviherbaspirillum sp.]|jgi:hypothetical protein|nr:hypothetical protein [Noviherbaspirillum sp.]MDB5794396.1 hypothetical protein [Noviherbaspirillum sp.]